jgi:hypothetical protein
MFAYVGTGTMAAREGYALDQLETNQQLQELTQAVSTGSFPGIIKS